MNNRVLDIKNLSFMYKDPDNDTSWTSILRNIDLSIEQGSIIGFAGERVIKQTIGEDLPKGFQRSEFLLKKGFIDKIVDRKDLKSTLSRTISLLK